MVSRVSGWGFCVRDPVRRGRNPAEGGLGATAWGRTSTRTRTPELHTAREPACAIPAAGAVRPTTEHYSTPFIRHTLLKEQSFQWGEKTRYPEDVCNNMRVRMTEQRERRLEQLCEATGEAAKSKAIDEAAEFYLRMAGDTTAVPTGAFVELMERAEAQGSVTPEEIADVLDTPQLPVSASVSWSVGRE